MAREHIHGCPRCGVALHTDERCPPALGHQLLASQAVAQAVFFEGRPVKVNPRACIRGCVLMAPPYPLTYFVVRSVLY